MQRSPRIDFDQVDQTSDPADFVRYLDATRATNFFQEIKWRSYALLDLEPGDAVCDRPARAPGCGTGDALIALARVVGADGWALGVDASATMIAEAARRAVVAGSAAEFRQMDAQRLDVPDERFDGVRAERLLQHLPEPDLALAEMVRVMKPGGRLVIWEADLDLFVIDAPDYAVSRVIQRFICDSFRHGGIGHELPRRFRDLGLTGVRATPLIREVSDLALIESAFDLTDSTRRAVAAGLVEPARADAWLASLAAAHEAGRFCSAVGGVLAVGRKPG